MKLDSDMITTKEALSWQGLHLLNFSQSSCSQKVRILLAEKGLTYRSREIDLKRQENTAPWFLGINPRGVVPVLVHDGAVHIESNDILAYIEDTFPGAQSWLPQTTQERDQSRSLMALEDKLHTSLRVITMGFIAPRKMMAKSEAELDTYEANGPDNAYRNEQIAWWRAFGQNGISDADASHALAAFKDAFERLDWRLQSRDFLLADRPTLVDIAWFISVHRLALAGYPLSQHRRLNAYYTALLNRPAFEREVSKAPLVLRIAGPLYWLSRRWRGTDLRRVSAATTAASA